ncbi:MAG: hypothetical protein EZS28_017018 [Streblomastix strix]|uniref:Uncharacterized protein n=1 Tax=Streblomastix strix TaxID=222440 RepID=A0A5J4VY05_9EUKA|nr:MAG: hypothetical protein EZS28_017018 [Streblomastix strix]
MQNPTSSQFLTTQSWPLLNCATRWQQRKVGEMLHPYNFCLSGETDAAYRDPSVGPNRAIIRSLIDNYSDYVSEKIISKEVLHLNLDGNDIFTAVSSTAKQAIKIWTNEKKLIYQMQ